MNKNYTLLLLFLLAAFLISCNKNETITPLTNIESDAKKSGVSAQVNNAYFASNINPAPVEGTDTTKVDTTQATPYYATYGRDSSSLIILADGKLNDQDSVKWAQILLWVTRFKGEDIYSVEDASSIAVFSVIDSTDNLRQFYSGSSPMPKGNVTINNFDRERNTISGTFEFTAQSNDSTLVIKNGVFNSVKIN